MFLGIEIGGTKLQLGVGLGQGAEIVALERREVDAGRGAAAILDLIQQAGAALIKEHEVTHIGIGFGGPVQAAAGKVIKSHQVEGWDAFPLASWCQGRLGIPAVLGNDCDVAALAEARYGAGQGKRSVFYVTVGTGIGGGFVLGRQVYGKGRPAVSEIGHLRPGPTADDADATVESLAAGPGIAATARQLLGQRHVDPSLVEDLQARCGQDLDQLTAKHIGAAAAAGNQLARATLVQSCRVLGWGIAQVITLLAPEVVVVGGGVSLIGEECFFAPLREEVRRYVFPPLADSFAIVPAQLGELVVVHGAIALAATR